MVRSFCQHIFDWVPVRARRRLQRGGECGENQGTRFPAFLELSFQCLDFVSESADLNSSPSAYRWYAQKLCLVACGAWVACDIEPQMCSGDSWCWVGILQPGSEPLFTGLRGVRFPMPHSPLPLALLFSLCPFFFMSSLKKVTYCSVFGSPISRFSESRVTLLFTHFWHQSVASLVHVSAYLEVTYSLRSLVGSRVVTTVLVVGGKPASSKSWILSLQVPHFAFHCTSLKSREHVGEWVCHYNCSNVVVYFKVKCYSHASPWYRVNISQIQEENTQH